MKRLGPIALGIFLALCIVVGVVQAQSLVPNMLGGCTPGLGGCSLGGGAGGSGPPGPSQRYMLLNGLNGFLTYNDGGLIILQGETGSMLLNHGGGFLTYNNGGLMCFNGNPSC